MNVNQKQKNTKEWQKGLVPLNKAQAGQVPIVFKNENGKKETGYVSLTDIELVLEGKTITVGELLCDMLNKVSENKKSIEKCLKYKEEILTLKSRIQDLEQYVALKEGGKDEEDII